MDTFTTLITMRHNVAVSIPSTRLDKWTERLHAGSEYNRLSRAIEAYVGIDMDTTHDMPETLEQLKAWYSESEGLTGIFNDAVKKYSIPITLIDETIAA
tara:strand:- start:110 stop:406 length:297 start_codon:yes stop_codon:yes gene_type:complete